MSSPAASQTASKGGKKGQQSPQKEVVTNGTSASGAKAQGASASGAKPSTGQKDYWVKGSRETEKQKTFYRNERWQARSANPHAPPKLTPAQRKARGPLPDWDEIQVLCS